MKRISLLLMLVFICTNLKAQVVGYQGHVDEYDIQGRWVVTSFNGRLIQVDREFEYMSFSGNQPGRLFMKQGDDIFYTLWFISNSNKLHISLADGHVLNFVIVDYQRGEQDYLKLKSFDDACTIELKMDWPVNHVNSVELNGNIPSKPYNLAGILSDCPKDVYIQNGKKYIAK